MVGWHLWATKNHLTGTKLRLLQLLVHDCDPSCARVALTSDMAFECLFVSRDPGVFSVIDRLLSQLSISTNLCLSSSKAFAEMTKGSTDLVVIDWMGEESSEFLQTIWKAGMWKKPTIVAITSSDCPTPGAHVVVKKPVT